ncbi:MULTISPECIES: Card1-like endonuclease domain-containing protein [unclassified Fusibacter]|uniref:Card1-like endonuclease domain-containing protein n=1 Tax=unclassified Fusibacter TaxID=2624464 RepID=UPI001011E6BD|nr:MULTISPECIES: DUF1887 family CARF protein [unclassified Fusibacter]MCK8060800.1 DUF1887 family CARF protein [Fusibacter sp. A2]NPE23096.1 DUF1887 family protein [Fusibacter sp. A1]RXV59767.1 DUF1887 family protein [Fusibacter sp. A1]
MRTVFYLEDKFNDENIMFTKAFQPHSIVYLSTIRGLHAGYYEDFADYIINDFPTVNIEVKYIEEVTIPVMTEIFKSYPMLDGVHLASSNSLLSIIATKASELAGVRSFYTDLSRDSILEFDGSKCNVVKSDIEGIEVSDYIDIAGGDILRKTTIFNEDPLIRLLTDFIAENQSRWKRIKRILGRPDVFNHHEENKGEIEAVLSNLDKSEYLQFKWLKTFMKSIGYVKTKKSKDGNLILKFKSPEHKQFLFITGSWLETFTYKTIQLVDDVTDIETGVSFSWDSGGDVVKNEVDVLVSYHSRLFCFSCKDSSNYDVNTLNELSVYAQRIGGANVKKVLVVTDAPRKDTVIERAREMGVYVLLYEGNPMGFRRQIERLFLDIDIMI